MSFFLKGSLFYKVLFFLKMIKKVPNQIIFELGTFKSLISIIKSYFTFPE